MTDFEVIMLILYIMHGALVALILLNMPRRKSWWRAVLIGGALWPFTVWLWGMHALLEEASS